jgi:hypothetical protein
MHYVMHFVLHAQLMDTVGNTMELPPKRPWTTFSDLHKGFKDLEGMQQPMSVKGRGQAKIRTFSASCTIHGHSKEYKDTSALMTLNDLKVGRKAANANKSHLERPSRGFSRTVHYWHSHRGVWTVYYHLGVSGQFMIGIYWRGLN